MKIEVGDLSVLGECLGAVVVGCVGNGAASLVLERSVGRLVGWLVGRPLLLQPFSLVFSVGRRNIALCQPNSTSHICAIHGRLVLLGSSSSLPVLAISQELIIEGVFDLGHYGCILSGRSSLSLSLHLSL